MKKLLLVAMMFCGVAQAVNLFGWINKHNGIRVAKGAGTVALLTYAVTKADRLPVEKVMGSLVVGSLGGYMLATYLEMKGCLPYCFPDKEIDRRLNDQLIISATTTAAVYLLAK